MGHDELTAYRERIEATLEEQSKDIKEIKDALLGTFGKNPSIGLIEETRSLRQKVTTLEEIITKQQIETTANTEFRRDSKKIVAGIAIVIPFLVEILKFGFISLWELLKGIRG